MSMESRAYDAQLQQCVWELTLACCFSCKHCGSSGGKARENELSTEECLSVADQLAELGCERVTLIGGEVFMRPDWDLIARRLYDHGVRPNIITNGFHFTPDLIGRIKNAGIEAVSVSVDGPRAIHDNYRHAGSYERARQAIRTMHETGIPVAVITTLNRENAACLESFYEEVKQWPLYAWQLQACSPMGNAASNGVDFRFDFQQVLDFVFNHVFDAPFMIGVADSIGYFSKGEGFLRGNLSGLALFPGCGAGLRSIGIDSIGNVRGCESMYDDVFIEGNLRERSLRDIWEDPEAFAYNRKFSMDMLSGACKNCRYGVLCAGGCRSYNYFVHKKLYESPFCVQKTEG